jgi:hypothetical protein
MTERLHLRSVGGSKSSPRNKNENAEFAKAGSAVLRWWVWGVAVSLVLEALESFQRCNVCKILRSSSSAFVLKQLVETNHVTSDSRGEIGLHGSSFDPDIEILRGARPSVHAHSVGPDDHEARVSGE